MDCFTGRAFMVTAATACARRVTGLGGGPGWWWWQQQRKEREKRRRVAVGGSLTGKLELNERRQTKAKSQRSLMPCHNDHMRIAKMV